MNFCSVGKQCITIVLPFYERFGLMISKHQTINGFMRKKGKNSRQLNCICSKTNSGVMVIFFNLLAKQQSNNNSRVNTYFLPNKNERQ